MLLIAIRQKQSSRLEIRVRKARRDSLATITCFCAIITRMYGTKALELYELLKRHGIVGAEGSISLTLMGTELKVNDKSATGNLLQEWLGEWMTLNGVYNRGNPNTQEFPDFYLSDDDRVNLLEVKAFDFANTPNFDVAQFDAYTRSLRTEAYKLDVDYLILGYSLSNGVIKINGIWIKKIWEITCSMKEYAIRAQVKQGKIHNIRPYNFKTMSKGAQPFNSRVAFLNAIEETLAKYTGDTASAEEWLAEVGASYSEFAKTQP